MAVRCHDVGPPGSPGGLSSIALTRRGDERVDAGLRAATTTHLPRYGHPSGKDVVPTLAVNDKMGSCLSASPDRYRAAG